MPDSDALGYQGGIAMGNCIVDTVEPQLHASSSDLMGTMSGVAEQKPKYKKKASPEGEPKKKKTSPARVLIPLEGSISQESNDATVINNDADSAPATSSSAVKKNKKNRVPFASPSIDDIQQELLSSGSSGNGPEPQCKCKKSRCLKLYCDCFALLKFCGDKCSCTECQNDPKFEEVRKVAIVATRQRTPTAFTNKVTPTSTHVAGCHCSRSQCLKKYCECFLGGAVCGDNCKCTACQNYLDSEALKIVRSIMTDGSTMTPNDLKQLKATARLLKAQTVTSSSSSTTGVQVGGDEGSMGSNGSPEGVRGDPTIHTDLNESQNSILGAHEELELDEEGQRRKRKFSSAESPVESAGLVTVIPSLEGTFPLTSSSSSSSSSGSSSSSINFLRNQSTLPPTQQQPDAQSEQQQAPLKKRKIREVTIVYPFFGPVAPSAPKIVALRCLEFLDGKSLYNMSVVNKLWSKAAMDPALWE